PRLVVFIVVDQMRADYITLYEHQWTKGLRRLVDTSAAFPLAAYPYTTTLTCAGHATIATGTLPSTHGMVANEWYDRQRARSVSCTDDPSVTSVPFAGRPGTDHHSLVRNRSLTFADELRLQARRPPTVVTMALKPRSAINLAGRPSPTTYTLWEENNGTWATSSAYTATPWPVGDQYLTAHPIAADYGQVWTRALPVASYLFSDAGLRELAPAEFPHALESKSGGPDSEFVTRWRRSPLSDEFLGRFGQHLVGALKLGQTPGTDVFGVSFSALDVVGHEYGPRSHEVQDILIRLDRTIGELLDTLDRLVGRDRYVVAFSSDHGVAPIPEQGAGVGISAGRYTSAAVRGAINTAIAGFFGEGTYVATSNWPNVYLAPGILSRVLATPGAREAVTKAALSVEGLSRVYWADELASSTRTDDLFLRAARLSYMADRSGDLVVLSNPYWIGQANGTTHGTVYDYDQRVPVMFAGAGIKPGRYLVPATPADIAPTLAYLAGITMAHTDGVVRTEAIK
ncbi:MAG TPA: alkaline phosphatase family protein, partial [Vicinamibacterales bacterium]|nr:alkaline phosphatase family protein [Vicinamibacterales bacterium]